MDKVYKFNKSWLDLLLENKDNENISFKLSDNDTRMLLTYIEILQNRIDKAIEYIEKNKIQNYDGYYIMLEGDCNKVIDILKESGD